MKVFQHLQHHNIPIYGIVHVGANNGVEADSYYATKADTCVYVEPIPEVFGRLEKNVSRFPRHFAVQALCTDRDGETVTFNVSSNGGASSSVLPLGDHATLFPDITYVNSIEMVSCKLDTLIKRFPKVFFNLLVIDVQGAELMVLKGATELLNELDAVFLEVNDAPLYEGCCTLDDLIDFLKPFGFRIKSLAIGKYGFGDALFLRKKKLVEAVGENVALGRPASQSSRSRWSKPDDPQGGNNGKKTGSYGFHTNTEVNPWWQVDLEQTRHVREIRVFNRIDMCTERVRTLAVMVSEDGETWQTLHTQEGSKFGGIDGRPLIVPVDWVPARYVRVGLNEKQALHLDEIEVYA